jgi:hypothetical protein
MRFTVEPSPAGGYHVRPLGSDAPLSPPRHRGGGRGAAACVRARRGELAFFTDHDALGAIDPQHPH